MYKYLMREERQWRQSALRGDQQKNNRQLKKTEIQKNLIEQKKKLFFDVHGQTLSQVVQRRWRVSRLGDIQNLIKHKHS